MSEVHRRLQRLEQQDAPRLRVLAVSDPVTHKDRRRVAAAGAVVVLVGPVDAAL